MYNLHRLKGLFCKLHRISEYNSNIWYQVNINWAFNYTQFSSWIKWIGVTLCTCRSSPKQKQT